MVPARRPWSLPTLAELPKLTALTLASAIGGGGGTGGGGSTVFGLLLAASTIAVLSLAACSADQPMEPSAPAMPKAIAAISCSGDVTTQKISCGAPQAAPGQEILSGQGFEVVLRSSNVHYADPDFTFDVSLQNLSMQRLGWDGSTPTGEEVFFVNGPIANIGSIGVVGGLTGTFTAPGQDYYQYIGTLDPQQTSGTVNWHFHLSGGATAFTFTVLVAADVFDQGGVLQWVPIKGTTQRWYNDVAVSSPTDRMAVGNNGLTAHFTGGQWIPRPAIVTEGINVVTAIAPGEYLAATGGGAVLHFKNNVWTEMYRRGDFGSFSAIWAKDTTEIVAVGLTGLISRFAGGSWSDEDVPTAGGGNFVAVSGSADGSLVSAVTDAFMIGEVWTSVGGGAFGVDPNFGPITGAASDIAYDASGNALVAYLDFSISPVGKIVSSTGDSLFSDGTRWPTMLIAHGTDQVAVGFFNFGIGGYSISDLDYSSLPAAETPLTGPVPPPFDLRQMAATNSAFTQFAVASGNGHLISWNGATWTDDQGFGDWVDPDLWGIGDTVWALDGIGGFYKIVGGVPTSLPSEPGLDRLWGISSTEFWAIDATEAWHFDPVNGWTDEHTVPGLAGRVNRDIWADPTGTSVIVLGENGEISSRISGVWADQSIPRNVNAVWGCDAHTAWIVTQEGEIWKWIDGVVSLDVATGPNPLRAINGNVFCDPWVAGDNGTMYHRLGGTWTNRFDPSATGWTLRALALRGAGQTIAAGDNGNAGLFSDASPLQSTPLPTQGGGIKSLWRLDNGEVYAAGDQVLLRGVR